MHDAQWMLYGATGYTGQLVAERAVELGHRPVLAGRNPDKVRALARKLGLKGIAFDLDDVQTIAEHIAGMDLVYHAAGPFVHTSDNMIRACLATHTHYLDISGELTVLANTFTYDEPARKVGVALISGAGFDVVPTDCLGAYVAAQVRAPIELEVAISSFGGVSAGTAKSALDMISQGIPVRRDGHMQHVGIASIKRKIPFPGGETPAMAVPLGDVVTGYHTTGIQNITGYMTLPSGVITAGRIFGGVGQAILRSQGVRRLLGRVIDRFVTGPSETTRETVQSMAWAKVTNSAGLSAQAWLILPEAYAYTALIAIPAIERTLELNPVGAQTPAQAWGADFALEVDGVQRLDRLTT